MKIFRRSTFWIPVCTYLVFVARLPGAEASSDDAAPQAQPQPPQTSSASAGTVSVTVTDPTGAAIPGATVTIENRVSRFERKTQTDQNGAARFTNVPPNKYHLQATANGFQTGSQDVAVRTAVPVTLTITLEIAAAKEEVEVRADATDIVESVPTVHTDISSELFNQLPASQPGNGVSDVITLAAPGVVADSNGFFHPLGDHAETGFSLDNQPITDQQSKQFSNQLPLNAISSFEVMSGAPPAEYGDKASLVVNAITRSALGQKKPVGSISVDYGSFGTISENASFGVGTEKFGNFIVANASRSGRYLDSPEFSPSHDIGNNQQFFDRIDWAPTSRDTAHLNLFAARSWFQIPNTYDQQASGQDQRQMIRSYNIAPGWIHLFSPTTALTISPFYRQDEVRYYPSRDPFADLPATVSQSRELRNTGFKVDVSYVKGAHNLKVGAQFTHYALTESFNLGITDPEFNNPCLPSGPGQPCAPNPDFQPGLAPYDLTRGGRPFTFRGSASIDQGAFYAQDSISLGGLTLMLGLRGDIYRGLSEDEGISPRVGVSYLYKPTATVFRLSYAHFFETPYNENLVLSSSTGVGGLAQNTFGAFGETPLQPGRRDQYGAGVQQGIARHVTIDADYFWKYTHNAFDFDTLFTTPIQFPIEWRKSKVDGLSVRVNLAPVHGFSGYTAMGHTRARYFGPETGGIIFNSPINAGVFRIDHDEAFEQTTHLRYQHKNGPWIGATWRYDSGMVVGRIADVSDVLALTANQQATIGFFCGSQKATRTTPIVSCTGSNYGASLIRIPTPGAYDPDHNPARVAPRHLIDLSAGIENLFKNKEGGRWSVQFSVVNVTNQAALYNFLSTFSGTHFVTPRSYRAELEYVF
ncbi:MAG TPA: carboxypeptidase regulatory-like domain-containing protein [Bryobacteraceae bacterium]|nr:carboxypeptidase regulatory-like domain-containing protein [Bryobacteraceae bacterium]